MIAAHIDEPRRLLLESEFSVCQWDMSRNWGSSLPRREWGSVGVGSGWRAVNWDVQHQTVELALHTTGSGEGNWKR